MRCTPENRGFALLEVCLALAIISALTLLCVPYWHVPDLDWLSFADEYLWLQSEALLSAQPQQQDIRGQEIGFNGKGNVSQARTLRLTSGSAGRSIIIELGGGRLVIPE
jgi:prepilin-type N-terminal cleavage/methylation domain-containing protein